MSAEPLFLGIDAGGSATRARLTSPSGAVFGEGAAGPGTARLGMDASFDAMLLAAREAWRAAGLGRLDFARLSAGAGIAGFRRQDVAEAFRARPHPFGALRLSDDGAIACLGAHGGGEGGVVIAGTGSIGYALVEGRSLRFGGYGFPASDEGSGARLGLGAVALAFRAADGREAEGGLGAAVLERFGGRPARLTAWCEAASATHYAELAPLVIEAANAGDPAAAVLCREAGIALAGLAEALRTVGCERVALLGGLARPLAPFLPPGLATDLEEPLGDALDGALALAGLAPAIAAVG